MTLMAGDVIACRGSVTGHATVREVFYVDAKPKHGGPRWRARVGYPQKRDSEIGPRGSRVEQCVDVAGAKVVRRALQGELFP